MKLEQPVTILVRRQGALGDVILVTGIVRELHNKYKGQCQIDVATDFGEVFYDNPYVHCIHHTSQIPDVDYNVVINLDDTYEINPNVSFIDNYNFRVFGDTTVNGEMELYANVTDVEGIDEFVKTINAEFIVIHMRNWHWAMKNIAVEVWMDLINKILAANDVIKIVCVGGPTDYFPEGHPRIVDGRNLSIQALSYLLDHAKCFAGIDSAPFHVAGTSSVHIVALLSHMYPEKVLPVRDHKQGSNCTVVQANVDCLGCHSRQKRPVRQIVCERGDYACNTLWDTKKIATAILDQL